MCHARQFKLTLHPSPVSPSPQHTHLAGAAAAPPSVGPAWQPCAVKSVPAHTEPAQRPCPAQPAGARSQCPPAAQTPAGREAVGRGGDSSAEHSKLIRLTENWRSREQRTASSFCPGSKGQLPHFVSHRRLQMPCAALKPLLRPVKACWGSHLASAVHEALDLHPLADVQCSHPLGGTCTTRRRLSWVSSTPKRLCKSCDAHPT